VTWALLLLRQDPDTKQSVEDSIHVLPFFILGYVVFIGLGWLMFALLPKMRPRLSVLLRILMALLGVMPLAAVLVGLTKAIGPILGLSIWMMLCAYLGAAVMYPRTAQGVLWSLGLSPVLGLCILAVAKLSA
jgi:hypothetical protein